MALGVRLQRRRDHCPERRLGDSDAQSRLALCYAYGNGVEKDAALGLNGKRGIPSRTRQHRQLLRERIFRRHWNSLPDEADCKSGHLPGTVEIFFFPGGERKKVFHGCNLLSYLVNQRDLDVAANRIIAIVLGV